MATTTAPQRLYYSGDDEADRLLARDPLALLIGFTLDQQVTVQKAFGGPLELQRRLGGRLDAVQIAARDPAELAELFRQRPALHRFPGNMAARVQALCAAIARDYGGDAARIWGEARDGQELRARLLGLPGIGEMKADTILAVLARRFGLRLPGLEAVLPDHPTLGDVDSPAALARYQAGKRAYKATLRAGGSAAEAGAAAMEVDAS
jgi:uncharacterized HhH-GPD family protein